jgi:hypothetical protein
MRVILSLLVMAACDRTVPVGDGSAVHGTAENCRILSAECQKMFIAEPDISWCVRKGVPPDGFDSTRYCPAACAALGAGELAACIAENRSLCEDPRSRDDALREACMSWRTIEPECEADCMRARRSCDEGCSVSTFQECMDCSAECGLALASCSRKCPLLGS